ncbi:hypothetical protein [Chitinophaga sp. CF418]|uniref:hypothetical protein n=1 Tax=Chitinophaga sp. CF418 TaxID=1855287 RepID=UPI00165F9BD2|nr:hypothetical protein [Chitinophaga sp. CF418]
MLEYLRRDGRRWHVARLRVKKAELEYNFDCDYMATIKVDRYSREGFKPIEL